MYVLIHSITVFNYSKEAMKEQKPCIEWDIRCFHYERRKVLCTLVMYDMWKFIFEKSKRKKLDEEEAIGGRENIVPLSPSIFSKKVVTHQTSQCYKFNRLVQNRKISY